MSLNYRSISLFRNLSCPKYPLFFSDPIVISTMELSFPTAFSTKLISKNADKTLLGSMSFSIFFSSFISDCLSGQYFSPDLIPNISWSKTIAVPSRDPLPVPDSPRFPSRFLSNAFVTFSDFSFFNYGHFLLDSLSRTLLFDKSKLHALGVNKIVTNRTLPPRVKSMFQNHLNLPIVELPSPYSVYFRDSFFTSYPTLNRRSSVQAIQAFEILSDKYISQHTGLLASGCAKHVRKIFIERLSVRRNIINYGEVKELLLSNGYICVNHSSDSYFEHLFLATHVVAVHGADVADIVFCRHLSLYIEITSSAHQYPYFSSIAQQKNSKFLVVSSPHRPDGSFLVDLSRLRDALSSHDK